MKGSRKLAFTVALVSINVAGRMALIGFFNIKPVAFITSIGGMVGGSSAGFMVGALTMMVSDALFFGAGLHTFVTSFSMGLLGLLSGIIWSGRLKTMPSRLELGVLGFLLTLLYDVLTSLIDPFGLYLLSSSPQGYAFWAYKSFINLFLPLGGVLYPAGPTHELVTALLLATAAPPILRRCRLYGLI